MKSKNLLISLIAIIGLILLLGACGAKKEETASTNSDTASSTPGTTEVANSANTSNSDSSTKENSNSAAEYFKGKTITFIVPFSNGGGYDTQARVVQNYLQEYTGATIIVKNQPGASGIVGSKLIYEAKPDGLTLGVLNGVAFAFGQLTNQPGLEGLDMTKYTYLGRFNAESQLLYTPTKSSIQSFDQLLAEKQQLKVATTGRASNGYLNSSAIMNAFDLPWELVTGFDGGNETQLAMERGDVQLQAESITGRIAEMRQGTARGLLVLGSERSEEFNDIPVVGEYYDQMDEDSKTLFNNLVDMYNIGRPIVGPPGLDPEKAEFLADAIDKALNNPEFKEEINKIYGPVGNEEAGEMTKIVERVINNEELKTSINSLFE
ncbi:Bug family tripartite tricarboxylate transporter substrate binding protein [Bacillus sp. Marseille-P3661]|uniref:Bug family tripartite tricarboxylate transporter substrate binding protein n=1 Tax=Bacillus sp. Marseille-P3661 TaxID=1936234 RepID=UPI000C84DF24|nr:tripartite tricarboxylate transporter substrate-binding protein [Bacillus sp. Marseille-P3661]